MPPGHTALRDEAIAALLAASPPRRVDPDLARAAKRQASPLFVLWFGLLFGALASLAAPVFFPWGIERDWRLQEEGSAFANGRIVEVSSTNLSLGKVRVWQYRFEFQPAGRSVIRGECFTTGRRWIRRDAVRIRYRPEDPAISCVEGARSSKSTLAGSLLLALPLIGFGMAGWAWASRRRVVLLLERGQAAEAMVAAVEDSGLRINNQPVVRITLQLLPPAAGTIRVRRSAQDAVQFAESRLASKLPVFVLFDPARPGRVVLPEIL